MIASTRKSARPAAGRLTALAPATLLILALTGLPALADAETAVDDARAEAYRLYDESNYGEALTLLRGIEAEGEADGPLLYRLWFCLRSAGDPEADATLQRALERLSREAPEAGDLRPAFYLSNAYGTLGRPDDAARVATAAVARVDDGSIPQPATPAEQFRFGKMLADLQQGERATEWLTRAVDGDRTGEGSIAGAYLRWAARHLGDAAWQSDDYLGASDYYTIAFDGGDPTYEDWDRLAVAHCRAGRFLKASAAWHRAKRTDPTRANRPRYAARIAQAADRLQDLSSAAPDGRLWIELTKPELEGLMTEQAQRSRSLRIEAEEEGMPLAPQRRQELQQGLNEARTRFVGAALEYLLQGHNIREAAFVGGFAPMVFKNSEWQLPPKPKRGRNRPGS